MNAKLSNTAVRCIEGVTEELDVHHTTCNGLFMVHIQMESLLYEVSYTIFDAFCCSWSLAEDDTIISIANENMLDNGSLNIAA